MQQQTDGNCVDAGATLETAALVLTAAMIDAQWPAADLGGALERMARTLHSWRNRDGRHDEQAEADREALANDLAICMQSLQYHDRLMQQLTAVRNLLTRALTGGAQDEKGVNWEQRVQRIREGEAPVRAQRLLEHVMREAGIANQAFACGHAAEGNVELF